MNLELYSSQIDAIHKMKNGCILNGAVGTGKSRTALAYVYLSELKGSLQINGEGAWKPPKIKKDIYIITTAKKRDSGEWEKELKPFKIKAVIDSWNNIQKYQKVYNSFFIFDEQRVVGSGAWVKAFLKITKKNHWILLSATPGDTWIDYVPVFIANGFYKNRTEFNMKHVIYKPYMNYPVIDKEHWIDEYELISQRNQILVHMRASRKIKKEKKKITCMYDKNKYKKIFRDRWDVFENKPIKETGKLCYLLRRVVNEDEDRINALKLLIYDHPKTIIFYNYTPELNILRGVAKELKYDIGEWNGEIHSEVPTSKKWVYLCQYTAASEGWNCITTDTIIFYSLSYSYKAITQAEGRIDRVNSPFDVLYYYYLESAAPIDLAIARALHEKRDFNERSFLGL